MWIKFTDKDQDYWSQALIAFSQVTFGVFWATIFLPIDPDKNYVLLLNGLISTLFLIEGWLIKRRK